MKTYFTPEEANALLPQIREELAALQLLKRRFEIKYRELKALRSAAGKAAALPAGDDPYFALECELEFMQLEANTMLKSFQLKGVQLKDIDRGLVDFPTRIDGREALLCWMLGEDRVEHYHGLHDGFAGRRKLRPNSDDETWKEI